MFATKKRLNGARIIALSAMGLSMGLLANQAQAATQEYFDVNGTSTSPTAYGITTGSTYNWDDANWATASGGATATGNFVQDSSGTNTGFARFYGSYSGVSYTVDVASDEQMVGMYLNQAGATLTISQTPSTSGDLNVRGSALQGFLVYGTSVVINAPITGNGGVEQEGTGTMSLFGNNSFTGGFESTGGQLTYYNNSNSFGTGGSITVSSGSQAFINSGAAGLTIPNNITLLTAGSNVNLVGGNASGSTPGTIFSGNVTLPATGTYTLNTSSTAANVDEISGEIGGASSINIADDGTMILAGANTYSGSTTVTAPATLKLAASGTIASSSKVILAGGTLNPGGLTQAMSATTLGTTAASTIDFGGAASEIDFANSSAASWTGALNLANWNPSVDALRFGTDSTGLTSAQLADIEFNGAGLGTASLNAAGYVTVPEPASLSLLALAAIPMLRRRRA